MSPSRRTDSDISVIGRATDILKQFRTSRGSLSAAALVRRTGLPKSTVYRMLGELVRVGLLERDGDDYRPGLLLFEIGEAVPRRRDLQEAASRPLAMLHQATRENVGLALLDGFDVVHLEVFRGSDSPRLPLHTGGRWPAHASASGKAILAFSGASVAMPTVLPRLTDATITHRGLLDTELAAIRRRGVAFDRQESVPRIVGVAAPVFGPDNNVVAAVSMSGVAGRINTAKMDAAVRTTALTISQSLADVRSVVRPVLQTRRGREVS